jgi:plastocyanin
MLWRNTVQREDDSEPIGFDPPHRQIQSGDSVFWFNQDSETDHLPFPTGGATDEWHPGAIPPQGSSDQVVFIAGSYPYECALHPDETGTIEVANVVALGPTFEGGAAFIPQTQSIIAGESVVWNNSDSQPHRPMPKNGPSDAWLEKDIEPGESSPFVAFDTVGSDPYVCALHPEETGTIVVANGVAISTGDTGTVYAPADFTIKAGQSVVWRNMDTQSHRPAPQGGADNAWLTRDIGPNAVSAAVAFRTAGPSAWRCTNHPNETGTITVI